jgi:ribosome recycling factor
MEEKRQALLELTNEKMSGPINRFEKDLHKIRAGKASPSMLEGVMVDYYGNMVAISQVANINTPDAKTILIQPWEKKTIDVIEKAILYANLGLTPVNDGIMIRISLPPLTEECRKEMVKQVKTEAENAKIALRNIRRDVNEDLKKLKKDGMAEDLCKDTEMLIQKITDNSIKSVDEIARIKEVEIMKV